ncbi:MAG TPA: TerC/Alx family metal homeostasis membrane protein [Alphaproteobacteria bacterium]|jgi:tellurite resistance protein TerC|nr:TerC/Alx family metal homeostasis membrane protein [Alphaproteobacteria bacterium]
MSDPIVSVPETPLWFWIAFTAAVLVILAFDLGLTKRRNDGAIGVTEACVRSAIYATMAFVFAGGLYLFRDPNSAVSFVTGFLIEWSLSVDNVFVFVLVFAHFMVPKRLEYRVLFWGVLAALVMRGTLIVAGAALIEAFHWVLFVFAAILIFSGVKMLIAADAEPDLARNPLLAFMRRWMRVTEDFEGSKFFVRRGRAMWVTPLFLALVVVNVADVVFAIDSIPAIFAVTSDPFIVYTANVFAILGLRSLYFALAGIVHTFYYLKYGLSLVLILIGGKMIANGIFGADAVPTEWALLGTAALVGGSILLSFLRPAKEARPHGWVPGTPLMEEPPPRRRER